MWHFRKWGITKMIDFIDKTSERNGTPINRENMMAVQGFIENDIEITTDINDNYAIIETNPNTNHKLNTNVVENTDGSMVITEVFHGEKTITKITTVNAEMNIISEVIR